MSGRRWRRGSRRRRISAKILQILHHSSFHVFGELADS
jgi:hypothetical protein